MTADRSAYYRALFIIAALFNACAGLTWMFAFEPMYALMGGGSVPQEPLFKLFFYFVCVLILIFAVVYYAISRTLASPVGSALAMIGVAGKLSLFAICFYYFATGGIPCPMAALVTADLLFAILFAEYILNARRLVSPSGI